MKFRIAFISLSIMAAAFTFSPAAHAQTASEWGHAIVGTGQDFLHSTEHVFHKVADDPILIERTKSALNDDRLTRNQPIIVSADGGVVILQGQVSRRVADRAVQIARDVPGSRGVRDELLTDGRPTARNYATPHHYYAPEYGPNYAPDHGRNYAPGPGLDYGPND
jgi:hypothetical protein